MLGFQRMDTPNSLKNSGGLDGTCIQRAVGCSDIEQA